MCQKILTMILLAVCISTLLIDRSYAQELKSKSSSNTNDTLQTTKKNFYIIPYLGVSTIVGNFGLEFQHKNYGYNIGIFKSIIAIDNSLCGGIRYYFKPYHHSLVVGLGGGIALDTPKPGDDLCGGWSGEIPDDGVCETGSVIDMYVGILIGYRWIWWNKLHLNIGAGPTYIKWKKIKEGNKADYLPMLDFVIGYSF